VSLVIPVLISAKDRPLYLWATLDNLYRRTRYPHQFILLDMASKDPLVRRVVAGFERRGMFHEIVWAKRNDPEILWSTILRISACGAPYLAYVESDVIIEPIDPCWLDCLVGLMERNPRLAMLGSAIDRDDFVDLETARRLEGQMPDPQLRALIKADSPERMQDPSCAGGADIFQPHNPAGRLLLVRNSSLHEVGPGTDVQLHDKFKAAGYETGVATAVRHRHLSLLHIFDYPDFDTDARSRFMTRVRTMPRDLLTKSADRPLAIALSMRRKWLSHAAVARLNALSGSISSLHARFAAAKRRSPSGSSDGA
jgi:hypothetical protein